ncbi:MAG: isoprenylcysteine carboxylmethyltransferase family protein [bacterium]|nr:isoprenylcysteine carboxylmethyltransferase family protein [bacterium]MCP5069669.1 isoprenylcysteine carboxylmethyltransferase family protein [bacterium]
MSGRLQSFPPAIRRAIVGSWAAIFIVVIFGLVPEWAAELNGKLGWPRWQTSGGQIMGVTLFLASLGLVIYCSRLFSRIGKGTPVPIDPPRELVVSGLYRFTRNPIYVGQVGILLSYFAYSGELLLLLHAAAWFLGVQSFIVWVEEPGLRKRFGAAYIEYTREVPRWIGIRSRRSV